MKILLFLIFSSIILFANIGKITGVKGEVYIKRDDTKLIAKVGSILYLKDTIITKEKSKALILFNDLTSITIGKNSTIQIEKYVFDTNVVSNNEAQFKFGQGIFRTITGKIGKLNKEKFLIKTGTATIGIRGTIFQVTVTPKNLMIYVQSGATWVLPKNKIIPINIAQGNTLTYNNKTGDIKTVYKETTENEQEETEEEKIQNTTKETIVPDNKPQDVVDKIEQAIQRVEEVEENIVVNIKEESEQEAQEEQDESEQEAQEEQEESEQEAQEEQDEAEQEAQEEQDEAEQEAQEEQDEAEQEAQEEQDEAEQEAQEEQDEAEQEAQEEEDEAEQEAQEEQDEAEQEAQEEQDEAEQEAQEEQDEAEQEAQEEQDEAEQEAQEEQDEAEQEAQEEQDEAEQEAQEEQDEAEQEAQEEQDEAEQEAQEEQDEAEQEAQEEENEQGEDEDGDKPDKPKKLKLTTTQLPLVDIDLENITTELMSDTNDTYMQFGYILQSPKIPTRINTYIVGNITPPHKIQKLNTATYNGGIASFVNGKSSNGTIQLDMDFTASNYEGVIKIDNGNWQASINSGSISTNRISSNDISSINTSSVTDISGSMEGKFYGSEANAVGGTFNLISPTQGSVIGVFGGTK